MTRKEKKRITSWAIIMIISHPVSVDNIHVADDDDHRADEGHPAHHLPTARPPGSRPLPPLARGPPLPMTSTRSPILDPASTCHLLTTMAGDR